MPGSIRERVNTLSYRWEGDLIIQDTITEDKRFVIGSPDTQIKTDIREWISFEDNNILKGIVRRLVNEKGLPTSRGPGDFDKRAMILWDFIARNVSYVHDSEKRGEEDFWLFPPEVCALRKGRLSGREFAPCKPPHHMRNKSFLCPRGPGRSVRRKRQIPGGPLLARIQERVRTMVHPRKHTRHCTLPNA